MEGSDHKAPEQDEPNNRRTNTHSAFVGVRLRGVTDGRIWWQAAICVHGKQFLLGCSFASKEAAARARDRALIAYLGRDSWWKRTPHFPLESYPEETDYQREGSDLRAFLRELKADVNPQGVPGIPHVPGWVPPKVWAKRGWSKILPESRYRRCEACVSCKRVPPDRPLCLNPIEREDDGQSEEDDALPGSVDHEAMRSDGVRLPHNVVVNNREKRQRAEAALRPKAAPEPADSLSGLGSTRHIRRREAEMAAIYYAEAKSTAEGTRPLYLLGQPGVRPLVPGARVDYEAQLRRFRICERRGGLVNLTDHSGVGANSEAFDSSRPQEAAVGPGAWVQHSKATEVAGTTEKPKDECRVCRNWEHSTEHCPVMAAATGVAGDPIPQPGLQRSLRKAVKTPEWLERVPERTKDTMVGLQNLAALYCLRAKGSGNKHLKQFTPEELLALALLGEEVVDAGLDPEEYARRVDESLGAVQQQPVPESESTEDGMASAGPS